MLKTNKCPKCGYSSDTAFEVCMRCGIVVMKFRQRREGTYRADKPTPAVDEEGSRGSCRTFLYIISRKWLWPVPLIFINGWVLLTSETIWTTRAPFVSRGGFQEAIAGERITLGFAFLLLVYWVTCTPIANYLGVGARGEASEAEVGCAVILLRALILLALCYITFQTFVNYG